MAKDYQPAPGEEELFRSRPAWRSFWVFILGFVLVVFGPLLKENPPISVPTGLFVGFVFAIIILKRWADVYTLTNQRIMVRGGLIYRETYEIRLADVRSIEAYQGINLRLVKAGHLVIRSVVPQQANIIMYGQPAPFELKNRMDSLVEEIRAQGEKPEETE